jgi:RPA family protein
MAHFRYRVTDPTGVIAGFRDRQTAADFAAFRSASQQNFAHLFEQTYGTGKNGAKSIAAFLRGEEMGPMRMPAQARQPEEIE